MPEDRYKQYREDASHRTRPPWYHRCHYVLTRLNAALESIVKTQLPPTESPVLIDYGCAIMPYRALFESAGVQYVGADIPGNTRATLLIAENGRVDSPDSSCDIVLSTQVLEHVSDPRRYLNECHRLLRSKGRLILSTHGYWKYHPDPNDYWRWTGDGLRRIVTEAGFAIKHFVGIGGLAGAGLQLFQDAIHRRLPTVLQGPYAYTMQRALYMLERVNPYRAHEHDAIVFVVVAEREG